MGYEGVQNFRDIQLSQQAAVDTSGEGGGDIQVQGRRVTLTDGSQIQTSTLGAEPGGTLTVIASESVEAIGTTADGRFGSGLFALVYLGATGAGGNLSVDTGRLIVRDGAWIFADTFGIRDAGTLTVRASNFVEVSRGGVLSTQVNSGAQGSGGDLTIETGILSISDGAVVVADTYGEGNAGNRYSRRWWQWR